MNNFERYVVFFISKMLSMNKTKTKYADTWDIITNFYLVYINNDINVDTSQFDNELVLAAIKEKFPEYGSKLIAVAVYTDPNVATEELKIYNDGAVTERLKDIPPFYFTTKDEFYKQWEITKQLLLKFDIEKYTNDEGNMPRIQLKIVLPDSESFNDIQSFSHEVYPSLFEVAGEIDISRSKTPVGVMCAFLKINHTRNIIITLLPDISNNLLN